MILQKKNKGHFADLNTDIMLLRQNTLDNDQNVDYNTFLIFCPFAI